jgi:hypothetical protein
MKNLNIIVIFILIFGLSIISGCTEPIELDLTTQPTRLVVDGVISNHTSIKVIRLSRSQPYFSTTESTPVSGAYISVSDGNKSFKFSESNEHPGYYFVYSNVFSPVPGKTYSLIIQNVDIDKNGISEIYTAVSEMPNVVPLDSVDLKYQYFDKDWEIWQVRAYFQDPQHIENQYMFRISINDNIETSRPSDLRISDDKFFKDNYVKALWVQSIDARETSRNLEIGSKITLEMASINQDFFNFLDAVKKDEQGENPLFSGPPANAPGNISNGAIGIFTTIATSTTSVNYNPAIHD